MFSSSEDTMDVAKTIKVVTASATALTNVALLFGLVWSLATGQKAILPVTFVALLLPFGYFSFADYKYFFGKK
jgi:hypothetical protein